jgi:hypothetical protein
MGINKESSLEKPINIRLGKIAGCVIASCYFLLIPEAQVEAADQPATGGIDTFWNEPAETLSAEEWEQIDSAKCTPIRDSLDKELSPDNWNPKFIKPKNRFKLQSNYSREGKKSLAISLYKNDPPINKDKPQEKQIHKHELRIANEKRCKFGEEAWYSFSFFITGDYPGKCPIPEKCSTRWVIGQWKDEGDGSPFLAQRFDNGVFHITVQRNKDRMIIASAPGDPGFRDVFNIKKAIQNQEIDKFPFIADPHTIKSIDGVMIETFDPVLPDPSKGWVDMRYHIKADRKGDAVIEVWADGNHVVRVTGSIGNDKKKNKHRRLTQYFKIGHYRDVDQQFEHATIYFDCFERSKSPNRVGSCEKLKK